MSFKRTIEDFTCEHCGHRIKGSGYTNHCPRCLWSKHVDVHPGDRAEVCGGMMQPVALEGSSPEYGIMHRCLRCGTKRKNAAAIEDDPEALLRIAKKRAKGDT
ncbi:RNHCP domain-containing protein [Candidatus Kaiserbacteria bacterium]|nr:RNHCP domain-containing protein [Candidatus Kaiserbacteria bacterium]